MDNKRFEELANNAAFMADLANCENNEAIQKLFADNGVALTAEEVTAFVKSVETDLSGELDENALEDVSGGCLHPVIVGMIKVRTALVVHAAHHVIRFLTRHRR